MTENQVTTADYEMAAVVVKAMQYLTTKDGQAAVNRMVQSGHSGLRQALFQQSWSIPWHNLAMPGWKP